MYYDDYLVHFGVKGMKWGVRKSEYKSADRATRKQMRNEYKKTDEYKDYKKASGKVGRAATIGGLVGSVPGGALLGSISAVRQIKKINPDMKMGQAIKEGYSNFGKSILKGTAIGSGVNLGVRLGVAVAQSKEFQNTVNAVRDEYDRNAFKRNLSSGNFGDAWNSAKNSRLGQDFGNGRVNGDYMSNYFQNKQGMDAAKAQVDEFRRKYGLNR